MKKFQILIAVIFLIGIILFLINPSWRAVFVNLFQLETIEDIREYVQSLGIWGPVILIFLMVLHGVTFIPAEVVTLADVVIFGPFLGVVYSWIGAMLGAYLSFFLAKIIGRPIVGKFVSGRMLNRFDTFIEKYGVKGLFALRLIPLVSFNALNFASGFTNITFWQFTWTTGLGILPASILIAVLYQSVAGLKYAFIGLAAVGLAILIGLILKARLEKKLKASEMSREEYQ